MDLETLLQKERRILKRVCIIIVLIHVILLFGIVQKTAHADLDFPTGHPSYGDMLPWDEVNHIIPRKSKFQVIDVETGLSFHVQRRAGSRHADVQPLTTTDTDIMKKLYERKWSWNRRAIVVKANNHLIAASMHGMPHGGGSLRNGFPGHFCIHFYQSTTHRSKNADLAHQLMVYKAAGKLSIYLEKATPFELIDVFLTALNQNDVSLLNLTLSQENMEQMDQIIYQLKKITANRRLTSFVEEDRSTFIIVEIPVEVQVYRKGVGVERMTLTFVVKRNSLIDRWQIRQVS